MKLDEVKKERIINASLKLFASYGYKHTSTDLITKEAEISKGLLFHYFGTKKNLYFYLYDYALNFILSEVSKNDYQELTDFFEIILTGIKLKWNVMKKYPYIYEFLLSAIKEKDEEIQKYVNSKHNIASDDSWESILSRVDKTKFKNADDINKIVSLIRNYGNGLMKEFIRINDIKAKDIEKNTKEFTEIILMLKTNFYKEEYL